MIGELASAMPAEGGFYVWVRREMVRPFRIPGGMVAVWVVSVCPVAMLVYAAYASRSEQVAHMPAVRIACRCRRARLLSALAVGVGQTAPHTTTHRDCCGLKDGSVESLALLALGVE